MTHVAHIGLIPNWIKGLAAPGYTNIFEIVKDAPTIYGTEHLCGDWRGELLVMAKDFAPAKEVRSLVARGYPAEKIFRHNDNDGRYHTGLKTNRQLMRWLYGNPDIVDGRYAQNCGTLYGSACFFLKEGNASADLENWRVGNPVFDLSRKVTEYAIGNMTNLRAIVCLGSNALVQMASIFGINHVPRIAEAVGQRLGPGMPLYVAPHPSRGANSDHQRAWNFIREDSKIAWIGTLPR